APRHVGRIASIYLRPAVQAARLASCIATLRRTRRQPGVVHTSRRHRGALHESAQRRDRKAGLRPGNALERNIAMLKLPSHGRYDYSSIDKRRNFEWPGGKRLAFYIALNVEEFAFMAGRGNDPFLRGNSPQTQRNFAWRDYGLRVGIWRIF